MASNLDYFTRLTLCIDARDMLQPSMRRALDIEDALYGLYMLGLDVHIVAPPDFVDHYNHQLETAGVWAAFRPVKCISQLPSPPQIMIGYCTKHYEGLAKNQGSWPFLYRLRPDSFLRIATSFLKTEKAQECLTLGVRHNHITPEDPRNSFWRAWLMVRMRRYQGGTSLHAVNHDGHVPHNNDAGGHHHHGKLLVR